MDGILLSLRAACRREATFRWLVLVVWAFVLRFEGDGVSSLVRCLGLAPCDYFNLLHFFHSSALDLRLLTKLWAESLLSLVSPVRLAGRTLFVCDAIKVPKAGEKMPGVKAMHQEASGNTKPDYIMGHFWSAVSLLAGQDGHYFAIPLRFALHDGIKRSPSEKATLLDKMADLLRDVLPCAGTVVADSFYSCRKILDALVGSGFHYIGAVRSTTVARRPAPVSTGKRGRGRPPKYGGTVKLAALFAQRHLFETADMKLYAELKNVRFYSIDLWWQGHFVRFVLTLFPNGRRKILLSTDLTLSPEMVIVGYSYRFKIETSFRAMVRMLFGFCYRFWMKAMRRQKRGAGDQYLHRAGKTYRKAVARKVAAFECFVNLAALSLGILQVVALRWPTTVWARFASWLRSRPAHGVPSENVVRQTLRSDLAGISPRSRRNSLLHQFLAGRQEPLNHRDPLRAAA